MATTTQTQIEEPDEDAARFADCLGLLPPGHVPSVELRLLATSWEVSWLEVEYRRGAMAITVAQMYWAMAKELDQ